MVALRETEAMTMIKHCVDYRTLVGKRDELGLPLTDRDLELLEELDLFFSERAGTGPEGVPEFARRDFRRRPLRLEVEFRAADGKAKGGRISNLSGGGVYIETTSPLAPGDRTVLRIFDAVAGREWRFGASVTRTDGTTGMGLRFVGIPLEVRLGHRNRPDNNPIRHAA